MDEIISLRERYPEMLFMSFPGDEKESGGCLAAGRGFFHINPHGGAEPCPASPYSDINVRDTSILEALFYEAIKTFKGAARRLELLFENKEKVEEILRN